MESVQPVRQGAPSRTVVAFDFDGTITVRDSFMDFLKWRAGPARYGVGMARLAPAAAAYLLHRDRGRLKAAAAGVFLRGVALGDLESACSAYAQDAWPRLIRPDAEQVWGTWKAKGALMAVVTASPETIVAPFAERLGADLLIGTRLALDAAGRITGGFSSANCRGEEKVRRLKEIFGNDLRLEAAYGDTSGDTEMLNLANESGFKVFTGKP